MWQECLLGVTWNPGCGSATGALYTTWAQAMGSCEGLEFGGVDDWRLPNASELFRLFDSLDDDFIDANFFQAFPDGTGLWSSTSTGNGVYALSDSSWIVGDPAFSRTSSTYARCVRSLDQ